MKKVTDKERLDWIQKTDACVGRLEDGRGKGRWQASGNNGVSYGATLREAIDKQMDFEAAPTPGPKEER